MVASKQVPFLEAKNHKRVAWDDLSKEAPKLYLLKRLTFRKG